MIHKAMRNFIQRTTICVVLPSTCLILCIPASATNYYVSTKGSDKGKGTQSSPWRTVNKALLSVPRDRGHTIRVGSGSFDLGGIVYAPSGVNLVGSGVNSTTLMGELRLIRVKNLSISNIKFNGKNLQYKVGVLIRKSSQLRLDNLVFNAYGEHALNIAEVSNSRINKITITDSSYNNWIKGGGGKQTSAVGIGNLTNFELTNVKIDTRKRGGAGVQSINDALPQDKPWEGPLGMFKNVKLSNLDIKVDKWNAWANGGTPQMALELWHLTCINCEISHSKFNSTVSLATNNSTRIHVHHNLWDGPDNPFYACEVGSDNIEFDHNYIRGGMYPLALFDKQRKINNLNVHHNIFENTKQGGALVGHFLGQVNNFKFINNTVNVNLANRLFYFEKGEVPNQLIRNNIFYSSIGKLGNILGTSVGVDNNLFFNISPVGSRAMTYDPKLTRSGIPSLYYKPRSGSQAVNLGAIQAGTSKWNVPQQ